MWVFDMISLNMTLFLFLPICTFFAITTCGTESKFSDSEQAKISHIVKSFVHHEQIRLICKKVIQCKGSTVSEHLP